MNPLHVDGQFAVQRSAIAQVPVDHTIEQTMNIIIIIYGRNGSFLTWLATSRGKSRSTVISASPRGQCSILNKFRIWKEGHIQMRENRSSYLVR